MARKQRAVVIFPGRGSYAAGELGYLARHHAGRAEITERLDTVRAKAGATSVQELDSLPKFAPGTHLPGRNASNLIYTCAQADFAAINREAFDVVAVCGNSLGWYLALAAGGALSLENGAHLVDTMGHLMESEGSGGQLLYPVSCDDWQVDQALKAKVLQLVAQTADAYLSIDLGGTLVLAGSAEAVKQLQAALPKDADRQAVVLPKHAAFHTPLLAPIAQTARGQLPSSLFQAPRIPLIDGQGQIWSPMGSDMSALYAYTLGTQITAPYDFAKSIEVALKEFAPDRLILAGPGASLGAPIAQCLIAQGWAGLRSREDFAALQASTPFLLAMGREEQRALAV